MHTEQGGHLSVILFTAFSDPALVFGDTFPFNITVRNLVAEATTQAYFPECLLKLIQTATLGTVMTIEVLWERLGIGKVLRDIASKKRQSKITYERALLAMTANRLCEPESKFGVWDRWLTKVHLPSCQDLKLDHMYEAMDFLYDHIDQVEESIF